MLSTNQRPQTNAFDENGYGELTRYSNVCAQPTIVDSACEDEAQCVCGIEHLPTAARVQTHCSMQKTATRRVLVDLMVVLAYILQILT